MNKLRGRTKESGVYRVPGGYEATWRDPDGNSRSRTFRRWEDARGHRREMLRAKERNTYTDPKLGKMRLREFWPRFLEAAHPSPSYGAFLDWAWRLYIAPKLGGRQIGRLSRLDVEAWVAGVAEERRPATAAASFRVLRRILSAAETDGIVGRNVAQGVKVPRSPREEMRFLSAPELAAIADAVPDRDRALVLLLGLGGLRIGEALALTVDDLDLLRRRVTVSKSATEVRGTVTIGPTKTDGSRRAVPIPAVVAEALATHLAAFPPGRDGLVFPDRDGGPMRRTNWRRRVWLPAVKRVGIADPLPRVHDLRHSAAALAIQAEAHPKAIQSMLGHSSITVTLDRYGHMFPSVAEQLADKLDAAFREAAAEPDRHSASEAR